MRGIKPEFVGDWKRHERPGEVATSAKRIGPFYGFNSELIASWCLVSVEEAAAWKRGESEPSPTAMKLFALYAAERVLDDKWEPGWIARRGVLVDPDGNECSRKLLRAYPFIVQLCRVLAYQSADQRAISMFEEAIREVA